MESSQIWDINVGRLGNWAGVLHENHATALVLIGVGHDHRSGETHVIIPENIPVMTLKLFVQHALEMIRNGEAKQAGG